MNVLRFYTLPQKSDTSIVIIIIYDEFNITIVILTSKYQKIKDSNRYYYF